MGSRLFRMRGLMHIALYLLMFTLLLPSSLAAPLAAPTIDIDDARSLPLGSAVTIKGTVTVPSGVFESGTFDKGFAIQDKTGGIYVSVPVDLGLRIGEQVEVTGDLADSFGLLILTTSADGIKRKGDGRPVAIESVATGAVNETTEGRLLEISGVVTQPVGDDLPYGYRLFVDDGSGEIQVFVYASTGIDLSGIQPGQSVRAIGMGAQFADHYEITPRFASDIQVLR
jgi:DNA/RNA endonuclease YhcR with UshA esterase domain